MKRAIFILIILIILSTIVGIIAVGLHNENKRLEALPFTITTANGTEINRDCSMQFVAGAEHTFNINKYFDFAILPNTSDKSNDFTFTIDGANKQFFSELGLYYAFDVTTTINSISIGVPQEATIKTLLQRIYTNKEIVMPAEFENSTKELFTLQLKEKGGKSVYYINFGINTMLIDLPENLVF